MPVNVGPLEWALMQLLPLLCGAAILVVLVIIAAAVLRKKPATPADSPAPPKDS